MTKSISKRILVSSLLIGILVLASNLPAAEALKVIYRGDKGTLTLEQQKLVLNFLLLHFEPGLAAQIMEKAIIVQARLGDTSSNITIKESFQGELPSGWMVGVDLNNNPWETDQILCASILSSPTHTSTWDVGGSGGKGSIAVFNLASENVLTCTWHIHRLSE